MIKLSVLILLVGISQTYAHISAGKCLESPVISDFAPSKYVGDWYEILHYPAIFEDGIKCVKATYKSLNATSISVHNFSIKEKDGSNITTDGYGVIQDLTKPNQVSVFFPFRGDEPQPYNVWMTDYTTYSLVYACKPVIKDLIKFETVWILARQNTLDQNLIDKLLSFYKGKGVDIEVFQKSIQSDCTY